MIRRRGLVRRPLARAAGPPARRESVTIFLQGPPACTTKSAPRSAAAHAHGPVDTSGNILGRAPLPLGALSSALALMWSALSSCPRVDLVVRCFSPPVSLSPRAGGRSPVPGPGSASSCEHSRGPQRPIRAEWSSTRGLAVGDIFCSGVATSSATFGNALPFLLQSDHLTR